MNKRNIFNLILSCLSGILLAVSTQEGNLTPLAWVALTPIFYVLTNLQSENVEKEKESGTKPFFKLLFCNNTFKSGVFSYITGFIYFAKLHFWANVFGVEAWIGMTLVLSFYFFLWGVVFNFLISKLNIVNAKRVIFTAICWAVFDYLRSLGHIGMNWGSIAYTQYKFLPLIQFVSFTGIYGLSFLMALCSSIVSEFFNRFLNNKKAAVPLYIKFYAISFLFIVTALTFLGGQKMSYDKSQTAKTIKVSLLQPSIEMDMKYDAIRKNNTEKIMQIINITKDMTFEAAKDSPDIIFWPETSFTGAFDISRRSERYVSALAEMSKTALVVGAVEVLPNGGTRNSAFLFDSNGELKGSYSKRRLVPFGEYLPLPQFAKNWKVFERVQDFTKGETLSRFQVNGVKFGTIICFESDFLEYASQEVRNGAQFIAVITNDAWFERYPPATHHLSWDVFRAVENHVNLVQAANSGISTVIDYNGNILASEGLFVKSIVTRDIKLLNPGSFYSRYGNIFIYIMFLAASVIILTSFKTVKPVKPIKKMGKKVKGRKKQTLYSLT